MSIDRRIIEVGPELADRVLAVGAHEHLPAEPDDGLRGRSVPVVREPFAIAGDHCLGMRRRPEDVIREEPVAIEGGEFGDLRGTDGGVPYEGGYAVQRPGCQREPLQRGAVLPTPVDDLLIPHRPQECVVLDGQGDRGPRILAEPRVHGPGVAAAQHQVDPAVGEVLQHREVLGDLDRVVGGDERGRGREQEPLRLGGDIGQQRGRRGRHERGVVVLAGRENVQTHVVGLLGDGNGGLDAFVFARRATRRGIRRDVPDREDPELHLPHAPFLLLAPVCPDGSLSDRRLVQHGRRD